MKMVAPSFEVVRRHLLELTLLPVELFDVGAEDLNSPLVRLEQLPGAGRRVAVSLDQATRVNTESLEQIAVNWIKVGANRREIAEAVRPNSHSDESVRTRSTERVEGGPPIGQDDVIDDQSGIGDVVWMPGVEESRSGERR